MGKVTVVLPNKIFNGYKKQVIVNDLLEDSTDIDIAIELLVNSVQTDYYSENNSANDNIQQMVRISNSTYENLTPFLKTKLVKSNNYWIVIDAEYYYSIKCSKQYLTQLVIDEKYITPIVKQNSNNRKTQVYIPKHRI